AALLIQHHVRANGDRLLLLYLLLPKSRVVQPEVHIEVLKVAFSRLVADRAVERMVSQQKFQHRAPAILGLDALGVHNHPVSDGCVAGDLKLGIFLYLHQADAAISSDRKSWMVTVARNEDTEPLCRLYDRAAMGD